MAHDARPSVFTNAAKPSREKHIIDILIEERAPKLASSPLWPIIRVFLNWLLDYKMAVQMADEIFPMRGLQAMEKVAELLSVKVKTSGFEHIPRTGRCILVANHPTGIGDGIAAWDAIKAIRPDLIFYANADAHRVAPGFIDSLIPVEWEYHKRSREKTRETLRLTAEAIAVERAVFIFPAGRLARVQNGVLMDPDWMSSAISIARKNKAPIIPIYMTGPWSFWFHFFAGFSSELRDITLFKELLNKRGRRFTFAAGPPILPEQLAGDALAVTARIKQHVEKKMAENASTPFF